MENKKQRKPLRLKGYDYTKPGYYYVTICTYDRVNLFGTINAGAGPRARPNTMKLNWVGAMIQSTWQQLPIHYNGVRLDKFVIMPNHIHGIIILNYFSGGLGIGPARGPAPAGRLSLCDVIHRFKSLTATRYRLGICSTRKIQSYKKLWQRSYHERIIRSWNDLQRIRDYMDKNPDVWDRDRNNQIGIQ